MRRRYSRYHRDSWDYDDRDRYYKEATKFVSKVTNRDRMNPFILVEIGEHSRGETYYFKHKGLDGVLNKGSQIKLGTWNIKGKENEVIAQVNSRGLLQVEYPSRGLEVSKKAYWDVNKLVKDLVKEAEFVEDYNGKSGPRNIPSNRNLEGFRILLLGKYTIVPNNMIGPGEKTTLKQLAKEFKKWKSLQKESYYPDEDYFEDSWREDEYDYFDEGERDDIMEDPAYSKFLTTLKMAGKKMADPDNLNRVFASWDETGAGDTDGDVDADWEDHEEADEEENKELGGHYGYSMNEIFNYTNNVSEIASEFFLGNNYTVIGGLFKMAYDFNVDLNDATKFCQFISIVLPLKKRAWRKNPGTYSNRVTFFKLLNENIDEDDAEIFYKLGPLVKRSGRGFWDLNELGEVLEKVQSRYRTQLDLYRV